MPPPPPDHAISGRRRLPVLLALITAGMAGNYVGLPIFLNVSFFFGSVFAMLALQLFGQARGLLAAVIIASGTCFTLNHPYFCVVTSAEIAMVGWLVAHRKMSLLLADTLYWLVLGMPLVALFSCVFMRVSFENSYLHMIKMAMNGIANALVARLMVTGWALRSRSGLISYREIGYNLLAFFLLFPALLQMAIGSRADFAETDLGIRKLLRRDSGQWAQGLEMWIENRKTPMLVLAEMAASRTPRQMQPFLELAKRSDANFKRVGLLDREAAITAHFPLLDELGRNTLGKSFADRPFIPVLKRTLKPVLSEVVMSKIGAPMPTVSILAPVVAGGEYAGYAIGVLSLEQIRHYLDQRADHRSTRYTLVDKNDNVIMSNRRGQAAMTPFVRDKGSLIPLDAGISRWLPAAPGNTPISESWKNSSYVVCAGIGNLAEWRLILEQPVAPFQKELYDYYAGKLTLLFLVLIGALLLAEYASGRMIASLRQLSVLTHQLPIKLATGSDEIVWPESGIEETHQLIENFKGMTDSLASQFRAIRQINASLEQWVEERTGQLAEVTLELNVILENVPLGISKTVGKRQVWVNRKIEELFQYPKEEVEFLTTRKLYPSQAAYEKACREAHRALSEGRLFEIEQELVRKDGVHRMFRLIGKALTPRESLGGVIWLLEDITERKRAEAELQQALAATKSANGTMSRLLDTVAHEFRTPLGLLIGSTDILDRYWDRLSPEKRLEQNGHIRSAARQLSFLVNSVTSFNLSEPSRTEQPPSVLAVESICRLIAAEVKTVWCTGQEFNFTAAADCGTALLDAILFRRILENLLTNAFRYTPSNGSVSLQVSRRRGSLLCEVTDTGIGIPEEDRQLIFEAFFRSRNVEGRRGLGLGLSIVHESLLKMGGSITVTSGIGAGSKMTVEIPVEDRG